MQHAKRARSRAQDEAATAAAAAAAAKAEAAAKADAEAAALEAAAAIAVAAAKTPSAARAHSFGLSLRERHPFAAAAAACSNGVVPTPSNRTSMPFEVPSFPATASTPTCGGEGLLSWTPGVGLASDLRRRSSSREAPVGAGVVRGVEEEMEVEVGEEDMGGEEGDGGGGGEGKYEAKGGEGGESEGGGRGVGCTGQEGTLCWRGVGAGGGSERQQREIDGGLGTIASRLRLAHDGGDGVGCGQAGGRGGGGGCDGRSGSGSGSGSSNSSSADKPRFTRGRASVIVHAQQGRTTSHPREHGHSAPSRTLPLAGDSSTSTSNHQDHRSGGHVANGVASSQSVAPVQCERRGGRFGNGGGGGNRGVSGGRGGGVSENLGSGVANSSRKNRYNRYADIGVVDWKCRGGGDNKERRSAPGTSGGGGGSGGSGGSGGASGPGVLHWRGPALSGGASSSGTASATGRASAVADDDDGDNDEGCAVVQPGAASFVGVAASSSTEPANCVAVPTQWTSPAEAAAAAAAGGVALESSAVSPALTERLAGLGGARFVDHVENHVTMPAVAAGQFEGEAGMGVGRAADLGHSGAVGQTEQVALQAAIAHASASPSPYLGGKASTATAAAGNAGSIEAPPPPATPAGSGYAANVRPSSNSRLKVVLRRS